MTKPTSLSGLQKAPRGSYKPSRYRKKKRKKKVVEIAGNVA